MLIFVGGSCGNVFSKDLTFAEIAERLNVSVSTVQFTDVSVKEMQSRQRLATFLDHIYARILDRDLIFVFFATQIEVAKVISVKFCRM